MEKRWKRRAEAETARNMQEKQLRGLWHPALILKTLLFLRNQPQSVLGTLCGRCVDVVRTLCMTLCRRCVWLFGNVVRTLCRALRAITGLRHTALTLKTEGFPKQSAISGPGNVVRTLCRRCVDVVRTLCMTLCVVLGGTLCGRFA